MTAIALIVTVVIALCCAILKRRRASQVFGAVSFIIVIGVGCGPVPAWLLGRLQAAYAGKPAIQWRDRNAIVLLGAGTERIPGAALIEPGIFSYSRIVEAAALHGDCLKAGGDCKIVVSGGDAARTGAPEAAIYVRVLSRLGVDSGDILHEAESMNTWQNAQFTRPVLQRYGADRVVLVSSGLHLRRSLLYLSHFGIRAIPVRADYLRARWSVLPLAYNFAVADFAIHEYVGIARYRVYNAFGWNPAAVHPGDAALDRGPFKRPILGRAAIDRVKKS